MNSADSGVYNMHWYISDYEDNEDDWIEKIKASECKKSLLPLLQEGFYKENIEKKMKMLYQDDTSKKFFSHVSHV